MGALFASFGPTRPRRRQATILLVSLVLAGMLAFVFSSRKADAAPTDDWSSYLFGPSRTGFNGAETAITPSSAGSLASQWTTSTGGAVISGEPVTSNGLVYWGAWDGIFRASKPGDGSTMWSANLGQTPTPSGCSGRTHGILGTATVTTETIGGNATSVVYVVGGNNTLYALNALTGTQIWKVQYAQSPTETWDSPLVYNGHVYIGTASWGDCPLTQSQVFEYDAASGTLLNSFNIVPNGCTGAGLSGSISVDPANNTLYFATGNPGSCPTTETTGEAVVALDASTFALIASWQVPAAQQTPDGDFVNTPTLFTATIGGTIHSLVGVANKNGIYYALDEANISAGPVWQDPIAVGGDTPQSGNGSISPSAWDGTTLYAAGGTTTINGVACKGSLRAVNPANGTYLWQDCLSDGPVLSPVSASPGIVAVAEGSALELVNSSNGTVLFKASETSQYYGGPAIANGTVYIGSQSGNLHAYSTAPPPPPPPPGTTVAQDTFQRANQSLWGTASDGHAWAAEANSSTLFSINNNAGQLAGGTGPHSAVLGPVVTDSQVLFTGSVTTFSGANIGAVLRFTDTNNWYKAYLDGTSLVVQKKVGGTNTNIGSAPFAATGATNYSLRFQDVGTTLNAKAWASNTTEPANWSITVTDSSFTSGNCGLRGQLGTGVTITYTSFLCTVPASPPPPPPPPPPGTTLSQDTFQRANQSLWGTASDGHTWAGEANSNSIFSINNNAGQVASGTGPHSAVLGPVTSNAEVLFTGSVNNFTGANVGAVLRFTDTNNWYKAYLDGTTLVVQKKVGGTNTIIGTASFAATSGTSYSLRFRVVGTSLFAKAWASNTTEPTGWTVTGTDSSLSSGSCGLRAQLASGVVVTYTSFLATYQ